MARETSHRPEQWLWVCRREFFHVIGSDPWWTCHPDTREGDLALLYRASPKSDIAFLMRATSDAYSIEHEPQAREHGWSDGCRYEVLHEFAVPVTLADLRGASRLEEWRALRQNFHRLVFPISKEE